MKGRFWKLNREGFILNDSSIEVIQDVFKPLLKEVTDAILALNLPRIHSIYLTGSVSRGLAEPGKSDLDIFAVQEIDETHSEPYTIDLNKQKLLYQHNCISDIQTEIWPWSYVFPHAPNRFSVAAFIIKTHSICLHGENLGTQIANFPPSIDIAYDDIIQIAPDIEEALLEIEQDASSDNIIYWCKRIMKNIIRTGFSLVMLQENRHTRDLDLCCETFCKYYPAETTHMQQALLLAAHPISSKDHLTIFLEGFGKWMIKEAAHWIQNYRVLKTKIEVT